MVLCWRRHGRAGAQPAARRIYGLKHCTNEFFFLYFALLKDPNRPSIRGCGVPGGCKNIDNQQGRQAQGRSRGLLTCMEQGALERPRILRRRRRAPGKKEKIRIFNIFFRGTEPLPYGSSDRRAAAGHEKQTEENTTNKNQLIKSFIQHNYEKTLFDSVGCPHRSGYR